MATTLTTQHSWVKFTTCPVEVIADDQGIPVVFVDPDDLAISEDHTVYGCQTCGVELTSSFQSECSGPE